MKKFTTVFAAALGAAGGGALVKKVWLEKYRGQRSKLEAANQERDFLYTWLLLEQKSVKLEEYFLAHGYKTAAILGMNREGRRLFDAVNGENISVVYGAEIDNLAAVHEILSVSRVGDDPLPAADCMVICDLERVPEKAAAIKTAFSGDIITLAQVLAWLLERHQIRPWDGAINGWPPDELVLLEDKL